MKMIAPKINGQCIHEVYWNEIDNCGSWLYTFNSGLIKIRIVHKMNGKSFYQIHYNYIVITPLDHKEMNSVQETADDAIEYLKKFRDNLSALLNGDVV